MTPVFIYLSSVGALLVVLLLFSLTKLDQRLQALLFVLIIASMPVFAYNYAVDKVAVECAK